MDEWEKISDNVLRKLFKIIGIKHKDKVFVNGDPRGYALKIRDKYNDKLRECSVDRDWGGDGIIAPDFRE